MIGPRSTFHATPIKLFSRDRSRVSVDPDPTFEKITRKLFEARWCREGRASTTFPTMAVDYARLRTPHRVVHTFIPILDRIETIIELRKSLDKVNTVGHPGFAPFERYIATPLTMYNSIERMELYLSQCERTPFNILF
jgi:hypothetical protein